MSLAHARARICQGGKGVERMTDAEMIQDAKEYLAQLKQLDHRIDEKRERLHELQYAATRITTSMTATGGRHSGYSDRVGDFTARIVDLQNEIADDVVQLAELRNAIINEIHGLEDWKSEAILYQHWILYKPLLTIAKELDISASSVMRKHKPALLQFAKNRQAGGETCRIG